MMIVKKGNALRPPISILFYASQVTCWPPLQENYSFHCDMVVVQIYKFTTNHWIHSEWILWCKNYTSIKLSRIFQDFGFHRLRQLENLLDFCSKLFFLDVRLTNHTSNLITLLRDIMWILSSKRASFRIEGIAKGTKMLLCLKLGIYISAELQMNRTLDFLIIVNCLRCFKTYTFPGLPRIQQIWTRCRGECLSVCMSKNLPRWFWCR